MSKLKQSYLLKYILPLFLLVTVWGLLYVNAATTRVECENMTLGGTYAAKITSPFSGVALYANNDYCATNFNFTTTTNTISVRGCSNNTSTAQVAVLIGGTRVGTLNFSGTTPSVQTLSNINTGTGTKELRLTVTNDVGTWDAYVDYVEVIDSGSTPSNLITNPGMEAGNTSGWTVNGAGTIALSTAQKHSGTYSLLHTGRTASWNGPLQNITSKVQNGMILNCSGWVRLDNTASASIVMTIKKVDGSGTTYTNIATGTGSNSSWVQLSGNYSLSVSGTLNELSIYFEGPASGTNYYIDDISTTASGTPTPSPTPTSTSTLTPTPTPGNRFHCFLLLGQSNMAGFALAQASDKVEDSRVLVLGYDNNQALGRVTDQWDVACPPLHAAWLDAVGPGDWFGKTMIQRVPAGDTIGLIPCAISGEKIETFMKVGGTKYNWIIHRAQLAQQAGGVIEGIIFHQGESNSGDTSWPNKVKTLVTDLRNDLNLGNVPFLPGELLYSGPCAGHNTLVNQLPSLITNCYVISANGLVQDPTDTTYHLHFSHDSSVELGKRYAAKMIQVLGW